MNVLFLFVHKLYYEWAHFICEQTILWIHKQKELIHNIVCEQTILWKCTFNIVCEQTKLEHMCSFCLWTNYKMHIALLVCEQTILCTCA